MTEPTKPKTTRRDGETRWYPAAICADCGEKHGRRSCGPATWSLGICDICRTTAPLTQPRDFEHLREGWKA